MFTNSAGEKFAKVYNLKQEQSGKITAGG